MSNNSLLDFRLTEYDLKTGKLLRSLELGEDFAYCGEFIFLPDGFLYEVENGDSAELYGPFFTKDHEDPLNRFEGLFNGRTYGEGRFVLISLDLFDHPLFHSDFKKIAHLIQETK